MDFRTWINNSQCNTNTEGGKLKQKIKDCILSSRKKIENSEDYYNILNEKNVFDGKRGDIWGQYNTCLKNLSRLENIRNKFVYRGN